MEAEQYTRKIDLMDEAVFPLRSRHAQNLNPKKAITAQVQVVPQSNEQIIDFVVDEMKDTLG